MENIEFKIKDKIKLGFKIIKKKYIILMVLIYIININLF